MPGVADVRVDEPAVRSEASDGPWIRNGFDGALLRIPEAQAVQAGFGLQRDERRAVFIASALQRHEDGAAGDRVVRDAEAAAQFDVGRDGDVRLETIEPRGRVDRRAAHFGGGVQCLLEGGAVVVNRRRCAVSRCQNEIFRLEIAEVMGRHGAQPVFARRQEGGIDVRLDVIDVRGVVFNVGLLRERAAEQVGHTDFFAEFDGGRFNGGDVAVGELQTAGLRGNDVFTCEIACVKRENAASVGADDCLAVHIDETAAVELGDRFEKRRCQDGLLGSRERAGVEGDADTVQLVEFQRCFAGCYRAVGYDGVRRAFAAFAEADANLHAGHVDVADVFPVGTADVDADGIDAVQFWIGEIREARVDFCGVFGGKDVETVKPSDIGREIHEETSFKREDLRVADGVQFVPFGADVDGFPRVQEDAVEDGEIVAAVFGGCIDGPWIRDWG